MNEYIDIDRFEKSFFKNDWNEEDVKEFSRVLSKTTEFVLLKDMNPESKYEYRLLKYKNND
jgi:hypothetical protein